MKFSFNANKKGLNAQIRYFLILTEMLKINMVDNEKIKKGYFIYDVEEHSLSLNPEPIGKEYKEIHKFAQQMYLFAQEKDINYDKKKVETTIRIIEILNYDDFSFFIPDAKEENMRNVLTTLGILQILGVDYSDMEETTISEIIGKYVIYNKTNNKITIEDEPKGSITYLDNVDDTVETMAQLTHIISSNT
jgi:hypothetical protein